LASVIDDALKKEVGALRGTVSRLETSVNRTLAQFESMKNGDIKDAALRVTTNSEATDLALASVQLTKEQYFTYTCTLLAEKLNAHYPGIKNHDILSMIKKFGLRGDIQYHYEIRTGKKATVNKWSEKTFKRLLEALESGEYSIPAKRRQNLLE
jgi:EC042_2821-lke REase